MPQFFVSHGLAAGDDFVIAGDDARHLKLVRRAQPGDEIRVRDAGGRLFLASLCALEEHQVRAQALRELEPAHNLPECVLLAALIKGSRFDDVVRQATEVGVTRIVPLVTERTIVDPSGKQDRLLGRWQTIAAEASKQCLRAAMPQLEAPRCFAEVLKEYPQLLRLVALPGPGLRAAGYSDRLGSGCAVLVGPEGGFSSREIEQALAAGWLPLRAGLTCYRAETAAVVLPALLIETILASQED
jgi:16S rRNA (uracil1498-N3)-methyltransferase